MSAAQAQIERAAADAKRKGMVITGYRPIIGALHPDGSPRLIIDMQKSALWSKMVEIAKEANERTPSKRGAFAVESPAQGDLL